MLNLRRPAVRLALLTLALSSPWFVQPSVAQNPNGTAQNSNTVASATESTLTPSTSAASTTTPNTTAAISDGGPDFPFDLFGPDENVPPVIGLNFTLDSTTQHSSVTGWSNIITPDLSYRFNRHFSVDGNVPWVVSVKAFVPITVKSVTTDTLESTNSVLGDATANGHFEAAKGDFGYNATATVGFPTGNSLYGLSANTTTYNINNHFEYSLGFFSPDIEIGEGNSSSLVNHSVKKSYTAVGQLADFQAGGSIDLPWKLGLDLEVYEALPIGNQNVYGTITKKVKGKTVSVQTLEGTGVAEDNGFTSELDVPMGPHFALTGSYDRSLRQGTDIVSIGINFILRTPKKPGGKFF